MTTEQKIKALRDFREAYINMQTVFETTEYEELPELIDAYPFEKSFNELDVNEWILKCLERLQSK